MVVFIITDNDWFAVVVNDERNNIERIDIGDGCSLGVNYLYRLDIDC
ncbi:Uncharacterised protein [Yersinia aldovae]|uniref:Uncharacterized protein n=1 Tax=Yersinia aldovae TaxID=29483 RepID=A0A0T9U617_YERAL|nr:hypothetical protein AT01_1038 [Yersinia aldovae 670-83]CNL21850.1 Uncharacterised protein [Yersinia aldovae]